MHQLVDKKNKIIIYLISLLILSTTNGKFVKNQNVYFSTINQINIKGLSNTDHKKIYNELNILDGRKINNLLGKKKFRGF